MMNNRPDDFEDINNTAEANVSHAETAENDFVDIGSYSAPERKNTILPKLPPKLSSVSYDEGIFQPQRTESTEYPTRSLKEPNKAHYVQQQ